MKRYLIIASTVAWIPLIYFAAFFSQFDVWHMKASTLITTLLFGASLFSCIAAIFAKDTVFWKAWRPEIGDE